MIDIVAIPLVTIIIPTYNAADDIEQALHSVFTQGFEHFEILIVDGLSTDRTIAKIRSLYGTDPRLSIHEAKDNGIYDAMNKGISLAKGDWVYFLGADDRLATKDVWEQLSPYLILENDIVYGDCIWMPQNIKEEGEWSLEVLLKANLNHQRIIYRRSMLKKFGSFNTKYKIAADHEMNIRLFCKMELRKKYVSITVAKYNSLGLSSRSRDLVFIEDWRLIFPANFENHFPMKMIYNSDGAYLRLLIDKNFYGKALIVLCKHLYYTRNIGFLKLIIIYFLKHRSTNAS